MTQATFGFFGFPMGIIAREMDNPYLHDWFARGRLELRADGAWLDGNKLPAHGLRWHR